jgi:hypothetical protein
MEKLLLENKKKGTTLIAKNGKSGILINSSDKDNLISIMISIKEAKLLKQWLINQIE